jgi:ketosteroid isomerase-like protein
MQETRIPRRDVLEAGIGIWMGAIVAPSSARALPDAGSSATNIDAIEQYYAAWEQKTWRPFDRLLAEDFTFTSPNNDDHISKNAFKERCWKSQVNFIKRFDLQHVIAQGDDAFVMYVCQTSNDKSFRNVEYLRMKQGQVLSIECYFGALSSFASAVSGG